MLGNKPPYTTMQQLNLDWVLSKLKTLLHLVPDDGAVGQILRRTRDGAEWSDEQGGGAVESVNGQTGAVVLDASDVGALPDSYVAPVTSVNGQTGAVVIPTGGNVDSVNGQTGTVVLDAADVGALPDSYVAPVTSVNGQTGAVVIPTGTPLDAYPVGSIYMSVNSTNPSTLFGGTWEQLENRFLIGAGSDYAAGTTGGEAEHILTVDEIPAHSHNWPSKYSANIGAYIWYTPWTNNAGTIDAQVRAHTDNTGGGQAHNNMPPYLSVYMWKRTA